MPQAPFFMPWVITPCLVLCLFWACETIKIELEKLLEMPRRVATCLNQGLFSSTASWKLKLANFAQICTPQLQTICDIVVERLHVVGEIPRAHTAAVRHCVQETFIAAVCGDRKVFRDHKCMIVLREFMSKVRSLLKWKKSIRCRRRLQKFLKARAVEGAEGSTNTPPDWADTRWSGWFDCSIWHAQNFVAFTRRKMHLMPPAQL